MRRIIRPAAWLTALALAPGCYRAAVPVLVAAAGAAVVTAAIVSAVAPPPPRVVVVPAPRPGYVWQPGYWTLRRGVWVWIDGRWIVSQPGYVWSPTHWERSPDGAWHLIGGHWTPVL